MTNTTNQIGAAINRNEAARRKAQRESADRRVFEVVEHWSSLGPDSTRTEHAVSAIVGLDLADTRKAIARLVRAGRIEAVAKYTLESTGRGRNRVGRCYRMTVEDTPEPAAEAAKTERREVFPIIVTDCGNCDGDTGNRRCVDWALVNGEPASVNRYDRHTVEVRWFAYEDASGTDVAKLRAKLEELHAKANDPDAPSIWRYDDRGEDALAARDEDGKTMFDRSREDFDTYTAPRIAAERAKTAERDAKRAAKTSNESAAAQRRDLVASRSKTEDEGERFHCAECGVALPTVRDGATSDFCDACDAKVCAEANGTALASSWALVVDNRDGSIEAKAGFGADKADADAKAYSRAVQECDEFNKAEGGAHYVALSWVACVSLGFAATLDAFCACGRRKGECDGSRKGCPSNDGPEDDGPGSGTKPDASDKAPETASNRAQGTDATANTGAHSVAATDDEAGLTYKERINRAQWRLAFASAGLPLVGRYDLAPGVWAKIESPDGIADAVSNGKEVARVLSGDRVYVCRRDWADRVIRLHNNVYAGRDYYNDFAIVAAPGGETRIRWGGGHSGGLNYADAFPVVGCDPEALAQVAAAKLAQAEQNKIKEAQTAIDRAEKLISDTFESVRVGDLVEYVGRSTKTAKPGDTGSVFWLRDGRIGFKQDPADRESEAFWCNVETPSGRRNVKHLVSWAKREAELCEASEPLRNAIALVRAERPTAAVLRMLNGTEVAQAGEAVAKMLSRYGVNVEVVAGDSVRVSATDLFEVLTHLADRR